MVGKGRVQVRRGELCVLSGNRLLLHHHHHHCQLHRICEAYVPATCFVITPTYIKTYEKCRIPITWRLDGRAATIEWRQWWWWYPLHGWWESAIFCHYSVVVATTALNHAPFHTKNIIGFSSVCGYVQYRKCSSVLQTCVCVCVDECGFLMHLTFYSVVEWNELQRAVQESFWLWKLHAGDKCKS